MGHSPALVGGFRRACSAEVCEYWNRIQLQKVGCCSAGRVERVVAVEYDFARKVELVLLKTLQSRIVSQLREHIFGLNVCSVIRSCSQICGKGNICATTYRHAGCHNPHATS